jgi:purine-binding chemotaxis protein CheW
MSTQMTSAASEPNLPNPVDRTPADDAAAHPAHFISFAIGDDQYGVDIMAVREIKGWTGIAGLPNQPDYLRGVLNLRGVMVPIIDLRCRFGQGMTQATPVHIVIIIQIDGRQVGLLADKVSDIVSFEAAQVQPVPRVTSAFETHFLSGLVTVDGAMIALLDLPNLLSEQFVKADAAPVAASRLVPPSQISPEKTA